MTIESQERSSLTNRVDLRLLIDIMFGSGKHNKNLCLCLCMFLPIILVSFRAKTTVAQDLSSIAERFSSPPAIASSDRPQLQNYPLSSSKNREYIFKKPDFSSTIFDRLYLVEVYGDSDLILDRVKQIEPQAFRKRGFIQVGKFRQQESAKQSIQQLAQSGLRSRITIVPGS
jgi:hypothetical protein